MNAFELISMSKGLNLGNLFDTEQVHILVTYCILSLATLHWSVELYSSSFTKFLCEKTNTCCPNITNFTLILNINYHLYGTMFPFAILHNHLNGVQNCNISLIVSDSFRSYKLYLDAAHFPHNKGLAFPKNKNTREKNVCTHKQNTSTHPGNQQTHMPLSGGNSIIQIARFLVLIMRTFYFIYYRNSKERQGLLRSVLPMK